MSKAENSALLFFDRYQARDFMNFAKNIDGRARVWYNVV